MTFWTRAWTTFLFAALLAPRGAAADEAAERERFEQSVGPLLVGRCLECHSGAEPEGGLDLSSAESARGGGDSGPPLTPGEPQRSLLWRRVRDDEMPPENPLTNQEKNSLRQWIERGAVWSAEPLDPFQVTTSRRAGYDWWSLQPIAEPRPPAVDEGPAENGIDRFVQARLAAQGLRPSPPAGRRELIRRLCFDLHGLPPTPGQVERFLTDDRPGAYGRLVGRLLASPHYGVRWARHWLDAARFGESQGFERDKIRDNAWPYRDWVVDALNRDLPYDQFVRLQVAGDVLAPDDPEAVIATGFLVAAPYDEVGQSQQSAAMRAVVRQDELEDLVGVVTQTFLGLTANCARCHDHKFDPIRQQEYYQLTAALAGVRHGSRDVRLAADERRTRRIESQIEQLRSDIRRLDDKVRARLEENGRQADAAGGGGGKEGPSEAPPLPLARWSFDAGLDDALGQLDGAAGGAARVAEGSLQLDGQSFVVTAPLTTDLREKTLEAWVRLEDLDQRGGGVISVETLDGRVFDAIVFGEQEPRRWMAGSNVFARTKSFGGPAEEPAGGPVHVAITYAADGTIAGYRNGRPYGRPYKSSGPVSFAAGKAQVVFGLRHHPPGGNRLLSGAVEAAQLYDRALTPAEVARSAAAGDTVGKLLAAMTPAERQRRDELRSQLASLRAALPRSRTLSTYCVVPRPPEAAHLLLRGNPAAEGPVVAPGGIESLVGLDADFGLPPDAGDADRRRQLADWLADPHSPLLARVIANRLWHHHFGVGLVDTPNDFGFNGGRPSHPELIDYLAQELIRSGWSLKSLHRLIVSSHTYRQSSRHRAAAAAVDAGNRLLWRRSPQRLDAESLRDAILRVSGQLNPRMGGPGYRDFDTFTRNTQFYVMKDPVGPEYNRRTIYRTWIRSGRSWLLDVFDCPDPSTKTPKRAVTVTPLQALSLMNNSFVLRMSDRFAERLAADAPGSVERRVRRAYQLALCRGPTAEELAEAEAFLNGQTLSEFCRVLLNCNEFLYVD